MQQGETEEVSGEMSNFKDERYPETYYAGRHCRNNRQAKVPPMTNLIDRHWWLAGWNDRDIELKPR